MTDRFIFLITYLTVTVTYFPRLNFREIKGPRKFLLNLFDSIKRIFLANREN